MVEKSELAQLLADARHGAGLVLIGPVAISEQGRITPRCTGIYTEKQVAAWRKLVVEMHGVGAQMMGIELNHAGRRGSTQPRTEGLDRPLREGNWPLLSASAIPYGKYSQVPQEMTCEDMARVRQEFAHAARCAFDAGFGVLQLNVAHGYLLASFLSPLSNQRADDYGGMLERRMRFPLEVFDALRASWPANQPLSVALNASDCVAGGLTIEDAVLVARALKEHGCDIISVEVGQTTSEGEPAYGRGFLTAYSDRIRNEAGIPTIVGGYLTTSDEVNTVIAAGRADLCIVETPDM
jgi:anthraniloyl-CoA monooxygenase